MILNQNYRKYSVKIRKMNYWRIKSRVKVNNTFSFKFTKKLNKIKLILKT